MKKLVLALMMVLPLACMAEVVPDRGQLDPRVRTVVYDPLNVVRLNTFYGVSTHIQFSADETIKEVAVGDSQAWDIQPRRNHLFVKPRATKADTNVTVITDRRVYQFALVVEPRDVKDEKAWRDPNLVFSLSFRYPQDEALLLAVRSRVDEQKSRTDEVKAKLTEAKARTENTDYWVCGSPEISPTKARDDGRFIYLTFSNNRDMPAVYTVSADGDEALVNTNVEGNSIVVQRMAPRLVLRKGKYVACLVNKSFDLDAGRDNTSGTVSPDVIRAVKGEQ